MSYRLYLVLCPLHWQCFPRFSNVMRQHCHDDHRSLRHRCHVSTCQTRAERLQMNSAHSVHVPAIATSESTTCFTGPGATTDPLKITPHLLSSHMTLAEAFANDKGQNPSIPSGMYPTGASTVPVFSNVSSLQINQPIHGFQSSSVTYPSQDLGQLNSTVEGGSRPATSLSTSDAGIGVSQPTRIPQRGNVTTDAGCATVQPDISSSHFQQAVETAAVVAARAAVKAQTAQSQPQQANVLANQPSTRLPKLELPTFDGALLAWPQFSDVFQTSVHDQPGISNVTKFTYLRTCLRGQALRTLDGLSVCNDNYQSAITLLQDKFGKADVIIATLYAKFQQLPTSSSRFEDIRRVYDDAETLLRQLENQGEKLDDQMSLCQQLMSKFPSEVMCKLQEWKSDSDTWTLKLFRSLLQRYIQLHDTSRHMTKASSASGRIGNPTLSNPAPSTADALLSQYLSSSSACPSQRTGQAPCVFCGNRHPHDECRKYATVGSRRQQLQHQKRCYICLRVGHISKECRQAAKRQCFHCKEKGKHHTTICPHLPSAAS